MGLAQWRVWAMFWASGPSGRKRAGCADWAAGCCWAKKRKRDQSGLRFWAGEKGSGPAGWAFNWVWFLPLFFFLIQTKLILFEFKFKFEFNTNTKTIKRDAPA